MTERGTNYYNEIAKNNTMGNFEDNTKMVF
jgi:hypothetical protein